MTDAHASTWRGRALLLRGALLIATLAVYAPHIPGDFVWDDQAYILQEPRMYGPHGAWDLFTQPFGPPGGGVYRPLSTLSYWAQMHLFGASMTALRAINIAIHAAVAQCLVSALAGLGVALEGALVAALLLALHPGATEGAMFINARHDSLGTLFSLLALAVSLRPASTPTARALTALGAAASTLLAMSAKEVFALTPGFLALAALLPSVSPRPFKERARRAVELVGASGVFVAVALLWRRHLAITTGNALTGAPLSEALRDMLACVAHYSTLAFTGRQGFTALAWHPPTTAVVAVTAACLALTSIALAALWRRAPATVERVAFGLAWMVTYAATSALAAPATGQYANRYLYYPLVGWALAVGALAAAAIGASERVRRLTLGASLACAGLFALISASQASHWKSGLTLFGADLPEGQNDARVLYHFGVSLARAQGCSAALGLFVRATEIEPTYWRAWHNVAGCLLQLDRPREAIEPARRALRLARSDVGNVLNLGSAYALSGQRARAEPLLRIGCAQRPGDPACELLRNP